MQGPGDRSNGPGAWPHRFRRRDTLDDTPGIAGFSSDTEILTRTQGWITFDRLTCLDEVATRSPDGLFEWQHPERVDVRRYDGSMWRLTARAVDILATPAQCLLVNQDARPVKASLPGWRSPDRRMPASIVAARTQRTGMAAGSGIPALSTWNAPDVESFDLPERRRRIHRRFPIIPGDDFAAFMGMYLAEGCATLTSADRRIVLIAQKPQSKGFGPYRELLTRMLGYPPLHSGGCFRFGWQALSDYLVQFGYAWEKWIPPEVLGMSSRQLGIFWHFYLLGDGYKRSDDGREGVVTTSRRMADGLQELVQKLGRSTAVRTTVFSGTVVWPDGRSTPAHRRRPVYTIKPRTSRVHRATAASTIRYCGVIGSTTVPNGAVYVRRNGFPAWVAA